MIFIIRVPISEKPTNRRIKALEKKGKKLCEKRNDPKRNAMKRQLDNWASEWNIARIRAEEAIAERGIDLDKLPKKTRWKLLAVETTKQWLALDKTIRRKMDKEMRGRRKDPMW